MPYLSSSRYRLSLPGRRTMAVVMNSSSLLPGTGSGALNGTEATRVELS
jgi:hypothetical protein